MNVSVPEPNDSLHEAEIINFTLKTLSFEIGEASSPSYGELGTLDHLKGVNPIQSSNTKPNEKVNGTQKVGHNVQNLNSRSNVCLVDCNKSKSFIDLVTSFF